MKVKLLPNGIMPKRGRASDAGFDIFLTEDVTFKPHTAVTLPTGVCIQVPEGYMGSVYIRSGVANKTGRKLILQNPPIDEGYTGEIHLMVVNTALFKKYKFKKGDRICQLVFHKIYRGDLEPVETLDKSERGDAWTGSSGR